MVLAWNPRREIPAGRALPRSGEEGPGNYHRDKCMGLRLRVQGASTGVWIYGGEREAFGRRGPEGEDYRPFTRDAPTSLLVGITNRWRKEGECMSDLVELHSAIIIVVESCRHRPGNVI